MAFTVFKISPTAVQCPNQLHADIANSVIITHDFQGFTAKNGTDFTFRFNEPPNGPLSAAEDAELVSILANLVCPPIIDDSLQITNISGQMLMTLKDPNRGNKRLSVDTSGVFDWSQTTVSNLTWLSPSLATAATSGYVMPLAGTIIKVVVNCANANGNTGNVHLFINGNDMGSIATISGAGEQSSVSNLLNIDFNAGDKLRAQVQGLGVLQTLNNVIVAVGVKWRVA